MIIIFILALLGFLNAFFLFYQHRREIKTGQKMFCLIGGDCGVVVGSKYGQTLGIKNEKIGMAYYALLIILLLVNQLLLAQIIALVAIVFSIYLLIVQTFILRQFCSWCLIAIGINVLTFYLLNI